MAQVTESAAQKNDERYRQLMGKSTLGIDVAIDDTTLRDGIQMPGTAVSPRDAAQVARLLDSMGVARIEVHQYQKPDREAIGLIKAMGLRARLAVWCRAAKSDVENAVGLDIDEVGISHPVSQAHIQAKWPEKTFEDILGNIIDVVEFAKAHGLTIFVHGEDSTRAEWENEKAIVNGVAAAGAKVYRICDTVGVGSSDPRIPLPNGIPAKIQSLKKETTIDCLEIHAHDDLGNAVENSIAAVRAADGLYDNIYVSTTMLGMGERAGNAETEKVMMNLYFHYGIAKFEPYISKLKETADYVGYATGVVIPPNKAIVGEYAFAHESGIHTHGVLRDPYTYEFIPPEIVGNVRRLSIGRQSGTAIIKHNLEELIKNPVDKDDLKLQLLVQLVKDEYSSGERKSSLKENEFVQLVRKAGFR
jgi:isopropylmalate/homocitrate/citramalate synthase